jgi:hypothetical protein
MQRSTFVFPSCYVRAISGLAPKAVADLSLEHIHWLPMLYKMGVCLAEKASITTSNGDEIL